MELSGRLNACATLYYLLGNILRCTVKCARSKNTDYRNLVCEATHSDCFVTWVYRKPPHLRPCWSQGSGVNQAVVCWSLISCKNTVINCSSIPMNTFWEEKITKWKTIGLPLFSVWNLLAKKIKHANDEIKLRVLRNICCTNYVGWTLKTKANLSERWLAEASSNKNPVMFYLDWRPPLYFIEIILVANIAILNRWNDLWTVYGIWVVLRKYWTLTHTLQHLRKSLNGNCLCRIVTGASCSWVSKICMSFGAWESETSVASPGDISRYTLFASYASY